MLAATGVVVAFTGTVVSGTWLQRRGLGPRPGHYVRFLRWGVNVAAAFSAGAGVIHLAVVPEHAAEYLPAGVFFVVLGVFQLVWAVVLPWRGTTLLRGVGLFANLATIALWAWSRTLGIPVGAEPRTPESVGYPDVIATAFELGLVVAVGLMLLDARDGPWLERLRVSELDAFVGSGLAISAVAIFTAVAIVAASSH
jgi:hypothetical protein